MVLFLQRHSFVRLLLHLDLFIRADAIYVYGKERNFSILDAAKLPSGLGEKLFSFLGFSRKLKAIDPELFSTTLWQANYDTVEIARQFERELERQGCYRFLLDYLGGDAALSRYYQARVAVYVSRFLHMVRLIQALSNGKDLHALLGHEEFSGLANSPCMLGLVNSFLPQRTRWLAALSRTLHGAYYRLQWLFLPFSRFLSVLPRFRFRSTAPRAYLLMMQMVWGVPQGAQDESMILKTPKDDFYLYSDRLKREDVLHYYDGSWNFDQYFRFRCNSYMDANGYAWADRRALWPDFPHLIRLLKLQGRVLAHALRQGFYWKDSPGFQNVSARGLWEALERELDLDHFDWRVVFDRTDYNPRHIIDTIVFGRRGTRTVGLHHCASPYDSPQIAFVHYSYYIALGEMFTRPYRDWWNPSMVVRIGRINIDWTVRSKNNSGVLRERFEKKNGAFSCRSLLMLPGDIYYLFPHRWRELESGLRRFVQSDLDMALIVRFKSIDEIQRSSNLRRIWDLCQSDRRLMLDQSGFSSYELMCISDLVLTPNCSSAINEAIALDIPVFTFDFHGRTPLVFRDYGSDFVIQTGEGLFDRLRSVPMGFDRYDVDFDRLRKEANFTYDGRNQERIRDFIADLALGFRIEDGRVEGARLRAPVHLMGG